MRAGTRIPLRKVAGSSQTVSEIFLISRGTAIRWSLSMHVFHYITFIVGDGRDYDFLKFLKPARHRLARNGDKIY